MVKVPKSNGDAINILLTGTLNCSFISMSLVVYGRTKGPLRRVLSGRNLSFFLRLRKGVNTRLSCSGAIVTANNSVILDRGTVRGLEGGNGMIFVSISLSRVGHEIAGVGAENVTFNGNRALSSICEIHCPLCGGCTSVAISVRLDDVRAAISTVIRGLGLRGRGWEGDGDIHCSNTFIIGCRGFLWVGVYENSLGTTFKGSKYWASVLFQVTIEVFFSHQLV